MKVRLLRLVNATLAVLLLTSTSFAQGFLLPEAAKEDVKFRMPRPDIVIDRWPRPLPVPEQQQQSYKIKEVAMNVNLNDQVAKVQVSQTFVNTGNVQMEVSFVFPLPYDGAVESLTFMVDDKEYAAKLLDATEARGIYESYVRRNIDPALMEWIGTGMFKTSVFPVPPGKERKVTLKYSQLCTKQNGVTEFVFPLRAAKYTDKPVETVSLKVNVNSTANLKNVYSPSHPAQMERPDNKHATLSYEGSNEIPQSDFRLLFDVGDKALGASVLSYRPDDKEDGYYLMLVSPEIKKQEDLAIAKKQVIVVLDRSGSMSGKKIEQGKNALKYVLNNLRQDDLFNVIAYDSIVESFKPELQKFNDETRKEAIGWVEGIYAGGSTNISGGLKAALSQLKDESTPAYVIFLTDGLPTTGETKLPAIVEGAKEQNKVRARIFTFGVGYDLNAKLLEKLAREGFGQSAYVRPEDDIEESVSTLYNKIGSPVMTDIAINWEVPEHKVEEGPVVNRQYPKDSYDLFMGEQLVMVGRYSKPASGKVIIKGKVGDKEETLDFQGGLVEKSNDETNAFIEKLWAMRRIGQIIDEIDLVGKNQELITELVDLSKRHGIMTPYTSFLAEEPGVAPVGPGPIAWRGRRELEEKADRAVDALKAAEGGASGVAQRDFKEQLRNAAAPAAQLGAAKYRAADKDEEVTVASVQNVGNKTFFYRGDTWVDSTITDEQLKHQKQIERYSKEYFDLAAKHGKDVAKYLAIEGKVSLRLGDEVYQF